MIRIIRIRKRIRSIDYNNNKDENRNDMNDNKDKKN